MHPHFLSDFYFSPNDRPSKTMKDVFISNKRLFSFLRYSDICISVFPLFLSVGHCFRSCSKTNLKVYGVINCLNKNLITHFVCILRRKKGMTLKLCPLIEYYIRNIFINKSCRKCAPKASTIPLFNFGK